ncbi:MotA/TolQ/ExbB proton channel family protein [Agarivorans aestuarii]|uniref:MotA/TolQ/ExbB proton channel family protein n=1 Tax=Agarivorans aestuarii TaxID=1563703 RepID=A0ABU7G0S4_9ALTE|nr:MotA/TolQ/ExbB proton channel family protein [Agarivorans aestuarii]MEE1673002.1 MotA/TolQ/ExbB proton channel family protein [Agarivorans aestuarii]
MRHLLLVGLMALTSHLAVAQENLLSTTEQAQQQEQQHNQNREQGFEQDLATLKKRQAALLAQRDALIADTDQLSGAFANNEKSLAELETELHLATGSLGELFGVVRQAAKELNLELQSSALVADKPEVLAILVTIEQARALPSMQELEGLWQAYVNAIQASGRISPIDLPYFDGEGQLQQQSLLRLGGFGLVNQQGYVAWDGKQAKSYIVQPDMTPTIGGLQQASNAIVSLDPSHGGLLQQLAEQPSFAQRFAHGGVVGKIIAGLFAIGMLIALYRGLRLFITRSQINAQLKRPEQPQNNPLGRVLQAYKADQDQAIEAIELRLLEQIVDEQQQLERGLSMIKLLAALAPMLGLLGTVTGMIETFQVITQFGNADPKVMASGISMALVTTVLGLISAMPLLLSHNILHAQAEAIRNILEKQSLGLVAQRAEANHSLKAVSDNAA